MSNLFSGVMGAIVGGGIVAGVLHLREKWQDELIASANFNDDPIILPNEVEVPVVKVKEVEETPVQPSTLVFTDEDRARQRETVERMVAQQEERKRRREEITAERAERKKREAMQEEVSVESAATYDPYTGIYKDGDFEVEVSIPVEVSAEIPTEFDFDASSNSKDVSEDSAFYIKCFNSLVEEDRVIPFDLRWLDDDGNLTGLSALDHRRHEKGFFSAITEDEQETAVIHVTRRGVTALRMRDNGIEWATSRHDHPVTHMEQLAPKEREKFRHDWEVYNNN